MKKIKSLLASALLALIVVAIFGFGLVAVGFAIILGGAFALVVRLAAGDPRAQPDESFETREQTNTDERASNVGAVPA